MNDIGTKRKNRNEAGLQDVKKYPYYKWMRNGASFLEDTVVW